MQLDERRLQTVEFSSLFQQALDLLESLFHLLRIFVLNLNLCWLDGRFIDQNFFSQLDILLLNCLLQGIDSILIILEFGQIFLFFY